MKDMILKHIADKDLEVNFDLELLDNLSDEAIRNIFFDSEGISTQKILNTDNFDIYKANLLDKRKFDDDPYIKNQIRELEEITRYQKAIKTYNKEMKARSEKINARASQYKGNQR